MTKGEIGKVQSAQIMIDNLYGDLQPGEYFTINLIGAEFDMDSNGDPRISSYSIEFDKRSSTSVTGRFLDNVTSREDLSISFYSKMLEDQATVEIDGEDSHLTSGTYIYGVTADSDISYTGVIQTGKSSPFYEAIDLEPIIIKEQYHGAFRSLQVYEYDTEELIKIEVPKGAYEFYDKEFTHPITIVVKAVGGEETWYELGKDPEVALNPERNILTFKQRNEDVISSLSQLHTIKIENLRLKATQSEGSQDVYAQMTGKWLGEQKVLLGNQVQEALILTTTTQEMEPGKEQRIKFTLQEAKPNTLLGAEELSFGLTEGTMINFKDDFILKLTDGIKTYTQGQSSFTVTLDEDIFTIEKFKRDYSRNLISIEGEFTAQVPDHVNDDIKFFVSDPKVPGVLYATVLTGYEAFYKPTAQFKVGSDHYKLDEVNHPIDASPYISTHNRIMVPLRYVAYALGVDSEDLKWDEASKTIILQGDKPMTINVETGEMVIGDTVTILSETRLMGGRTFVPVGEIGRAFGAEVEWDVHSRTATFN